MPATTSRAPRARRCSTSTRRPSRSCERCPPAFLWEESRKHKTGVIASLPADVQAFAEATWNGCQAHPFNPENPEQYQQWYFLPWHRHMLHQFEQTIREVLK